jgi:4-hydroxymandelate oxidase
VYVTGPPVGGDRPSPGAPRLRRAARRVFAEQSELALDPELRVFLGDMVAPYGLPLREDLLAAGCGQAYAQMAEALLPAVLPAGEAVDLIVLAFAIHDIRIGQATAVYLSGRCAGDPLAFAVCDQGAAAAYTGLRLVGEYARSGCRRGLLLVVEQSALHYQPAAVSGPAAPVPDVHAAVALLFDQTGPAGRAAVRQFPATAPGDVPAGLAAAVAEVAAGRPDVTLIAGPGLAGVPVPAGAGWRILAAPAGQPYTGTWWELAGLCPEWTDGGPLVLLADYDPALGYLCLAALDAATPAPAAHAAAGGAVGGAVGGASAARAAGAAGTNGLAPARPGGPGGP